ncbi:MAG: PTS sugar transporter subunit IIA [Myxococcota bacterium]
MSSLADLVTPERVALALAAEDKHAAIQELSSLLVGDADAKPVFDALWAREQLASTGVGSGVAIPHGRVRGVDEIRAALAIHPAGLPFDAIDGEPVHVFVAILAPEDRPSHHLRVLAEVSRLLRSADVRTRMRNAPTVEALRACLG